MGASDPIVIPFYKKHITNICSPIALLGFTNNNLFQGDLYDKSMGNWDINGDWKLNKKYSTIICTRCAYFAKDPKVFIEKCYDELDNNGILYVDWGLGDHWRFKNFKVGWIKDGEQEYAYEKNNFLWSMVWDNSFLKNEQCKIFKNTIKSYGYSNLSRAIHDEVPSILPFNYIGRYFDNIEYNILTIIKPYLQMYVLIKGEKRRL